MAKGRAKDLASITTIWRNKKTNLLCEETSSYLMIIHKLKKNTKEPRLT